MTQSFNDANTIANQDPFLLSFALDAAKMGIWIWELESDRVNWFGHLDEIFGLKFGQAPLNREQFIQLVHPEDREDVLGSIVGALEGKVAHYTVLHRTIRPDQSIRWVEGRGQVYRDGLGRPIRMIGTAVDVTEFRAIQSTLLNLAARTLSVTGEHYFKEAVKTVAVTLEADYAYISELVSKQPARIKVLASWGMPHCESNASEYEVHETPCKEVLLNGRSFSQSRGIREFYPESDFLAHTGAEAYVGIPLFGNQNEPIGVMAALFKRPLHNLKVYESALEILSARTAGEICRAHLEQNLRFSNERLYSIIENTPDVAIQAYDSDARVVMWNKASEKVYGWKAEDAIGRYLNEVGFTSKMEERLKERIQSISKTSGPLPAEEYGYVRKDGEPGYCLSTLFQIPGEGGQKLYICMDVDITERKREEAEKDRLYEKASEAVKLREEFISVASHELRTPLTALQARIQLLSRSLKRHSTSLPVSSQLSQLVHGAMQDIQRFGGLIETLLDVTRMGAGPFALNPESFDFSEMVREVVNRVVAVDESGVDRVKVRAPGPVMGRWDRFRVEQLVSNLLSNALKFGGNSTVWVEVKAEQDQVTLTVSDQGIGIPKEKQADVFGRFSRAVSERRYGGLGLGLYISKQVAEAHGGTIRLSSTLGQGTTFTVELPRTPGHALSFVA